MITPLIESLGRTDVRVITVRNDFFGGNTGVTGLITGEDVSRTLAAEPEGHRYLLPDVCLSDEGRFLDGMTVERTSPARRDRRDRRHRPAQGIGHQSARAGTEQP